MIFPNCADAANALTGTLQEAALSAGLATFTDLLNDPTKLPQSAITITQKGIAVAQSVAQDPFGALTWGMEAALGVAAVAAQTSKQIIKDIDGKT